LGTGERDKPREGAEDGGDWKALRRLGAELQVVELEELAASVGLAGTKGARGVMVELLIIRELVAVAWARLHEGERGEVPSWVVLTATTVSMAVAVGAALTAWMMNRVHSIQAQ